MAPNENLIFESPSLAPLPHRLGWAFFTAVFWMLWVYLWMPLVTLLGWGLGLQAYSGYFSDSGLFKMHQLERIAIIYTSVVCIMGGSLLLWARIEFMRFHNVNRRSIPKHVRIEEVAAYAEVPLPAIEAWTASRRVVIHHAPDGSVILKEEDVRTG
jgi:biofilm PGA synthesis protein PgaD